MRQIHREITDAPRFSHRAMLLVRICVTFPGLLKQEHVEFAPDFCNFHGNSRKSSQNLQDTSRHWLPLDAIKYHIDGMESNKLNVRWLPSQRQNISVTV